MAVIVAHQIYRIKLTGDRVWVESIESDGSVMAKRQTHTKLNGDVYVTDRWHPDELETEEEYAHSQAQAGKVLADMLRSNGVVVLDNTGSTKFEKDPSAN